MKSMLFKEMDLKYGDVLDSDFDPEQLKKGVKVEMKHTENPAIAKQIVKAHLKENPKYYDYLDEMEKKMPKKR